MGLGACSENTGQGDDVVDTDTARTGAIATDPKDSLGPAPEVPGATKGGTVYILRESKISHLDPQRTYSFAGLMGSQLFARTLTAFKDDGKGNVTLVGDLAETPGTNVNNDCKVWEFKIKDGVKFEDGTPDHLQARSRTASPARSTPTSPAARPTSRSGWPTPRSTTPSGTSRPTRRRCRPGLTTPDAKTLRFEFAKPRCDLPFALSLPASAPLPPAKDTGVNLDNLPFSSGPYKITKHTPGVEMVLERNEQLGPGHRPGAPPVPGQVRVVVRRGQRHPDQPRASPTTATTRTRSAPAASRRSWSPRWPATRRSRTRTVLAATPNAYRLSINTQRVTDLAVRQAINYAIDREGIIKNLGGQYGAVPITTLMPPTTIGFKKYDAYPAGATGDAEKAKELLAGKTPRAGRSARPTTPRRRRPRPRSRTTWRRPASRSP